MPNVPKQFKSSERVAYSQSRQTANRRGYNHRWQRSRTVFLALNPLCVECERKGKTTPARDVDHIKPHRGDMLLFWDANNWQPLCRDCHNAKTGRGE